MLKQKSYKDIKSHTTAAVAAVKKLWDDMKNRDRKEVGPCKNKNHLKVLIPEIWSEKHQHPGNKSSKKKKDKVNLHDLDKLFSAFLEKSQEKQPCKGKKIQ